MKILNSYALTLTELLLSTVVIGVIMLGVVSSDVAIRKESDQGFYSTQATLNGQIILSHIMRNAALAVGHGTGGQKGILIGNSETGSSNTFCIRQDLNLNGSEHTPPTPSNYADDRFVCYSVTNNGLFTCNKSSAGNCAVNDTGYQLVGEVDTTSTDVTNSQCGVYPQFSVVLSSTSNLSTQKLLFNVKVTIEDKSSSTNTKSVFASISPQGHSL